MKQLVRLADPAGAVAAFAAERLHSTQLRFRDVDVQLLSTDPGPLEYVERVYGYFRVPQRDHAALRMLVVDEASPAQGLLRTQLAVPRPVAGHVLVASWFAWAIVLADDAMLRYYASKLLRLAVVEAWARDIVTLHAASVCAATGGALLVGEAAAGKTSLTLNLIDRGLRYCADDTSPLRRDDLTCIPFPTPFTVRADQRSGRPARDELRGRRPDIAVVNDPRWLVDRPDAVAEPFRPTKVVFVDRSATAGATISSVTPTDALFELLRNTVVPLGADAEALAAQGADFDTFSELVSSVDCHRLDSRDLPRATDALLELMGAAAPCLT